MTVRYRTSNSTSDYYEVTDKSVGHLITVVHTKFGTFVCLTCRCVGCDHAKDTEDFVAAGNGPERTQLTTQAP